MCQVSQDDMILIPKQDVKKLKKCLKCDNESQVVTRINEALCKSCFNDYFTHKFRLTVSKMRFDHGDIVLFPYSGSQSSVAMLYLLNQGLGPRARKKFQFKPTLLFIEESSFYGNVTIEQQIENMKKIKESIEYTEFKIYFSLLENVFESDNLIYENLNDVKFDSNLQHKLETLTKDVKSLTSRQELLKQLRTNLILKIAAILKLKKIALANSCTKSSIEFISNIAQGKGHNINAEMNMIENRDGCLICKPMREITNKEIAFYSYYNNLEEVNYWPSSQFVSLNSTIFNLTESFVVGLQSGYPTTVPTIFRVGEKVSESIRNVDTNHDTCQLCKCRLIHIEDDVSSKSALNNINFAKLITQNSDINHNTDIIERLKVEANKYSNYCFACKIILNESTHAHDLDEALVVKKLNTDDKELIVKDFLLKD